MRSTFLPFLLMAAMMPLSLRAQIPASARQQDPAGFVGVWRGSFDKLPAVDLVVTDEGGGLHGAILFYLHRRPDASSSYTATPGFPEPLLDLAVDHQTLRFEVSHRRAHPPGSLHDAPVHFHLKLLEPGRAELKNESEGAPTVIMKRSDY